MKAICNCLAAIEFHNKRGNKLSDGECPVCGQIGTMHRAVCHYDNIRERYYYTYNGVNYILSDNEEFFILL